MRIAVIIPARNEAENIEQTLHSLQSWRQRGHQVMLVDGGSSDATVERARSLTDLVLESEPGRAQQMNIGAENADAEIFLFLHADTQIEPDADQLIIDAVTGGCGWGRFSVGFNNRAIIFKVIASLMNLRSCITSIATGDQAIFVEQALFNQVGRYPAQPLMEDIQLSINLRRQQRACCLQSRVITSARRWQQKGIVRTVALMWMLRLGYFFGISAQSLKRWYD